jgi:phytoene dehydrogenase-like protein
MLRPLRSRHSFEQQLNTDAARRAWRAFVDRPLGESIEEFADHDALRGLLLTDGKIGVLTHAHDPRLLQNRCFLYHVIGNETGEWRVPVGGMKSVVDSLLSRCRGLGAEVLCNTEALGVTIGKTNHEVTFQHEGKEQTLAAKHVLVNAAPSTFAKLLSIPLESTPEDEGSVVKINMLLKRLPNLKSNVAAAEAFAGSFHIDEGYEQMQASWQAAQKALLPTPAPGEVYCHTLTDDSILSVELREQGYHTLTLFGLDMPWRSFENEHDQKREQALQLFMAGLDRLCEDSFDDCLARDSIGEPCVEIKTPQDLQTEIGLDQGNIFHNALSWFFGQDDEVGSWGVETDFPRIYRAGSSALRGGAVSGIPGHNAAMKVLES